MITVTFDIQVYVWVVWSTVREEHMNKSGYLMVRDVGSFWKRLCFRNLGFRREILEIEIDLMTMY